MSYPEYGNIVVCKTSQKVVGCGENGGARPCNRGLECANSCTLGGQSIFRAKGFAVAHGLRVSEVECSSCGFKSYARVVNQSGECEYKG